MHRRAARLASIVALAVILVVVCLVAPAGAQDVEAPRAAPQPPDVARLAANETPPLHGVSQSQTPGAGFVAKFLLGGALGLGLHESGHLATDFLFDAHPGVKRVHFGPIPFFAITHRGDLSPRREFTISSTGFWMQQLGSEILLSTRPNLRAERAPVRQGLLAFNVLASVAYAAAAMAQAGPPERDTRSMAASAGMREASVGAMLLVPAALDTARCFHPGNRWLTWGSRAAKAGMVLLVLRNRR